MSEFEPRDAEAQPIPPNNIQKQIQYMYNIFLHFCVLIGVTYSYWKCTIVRRPFPLFTALYSSKTSSPSVRGRESNRLSDMCTASRHTPIFTNWADFLLFVFFNMARYLSYIYLGSSVCHIPVIFLSYSCHIPIVVAERWAILYVLVIKLTKETRQRVSRERVRDGKIGKGQIGEGGCE